MSFLPTQDTKTTTVAVTSTDVALDYAAGMNTVVRLLHTGATPIFIKFGKAAETVTLTSGIACAPNNDYFFTKPQTATKLMTIIASGTASLYTTEGLL